MPSTMPAVVQFEVQKGAVELREVKLPEIGARDVLLRVGGVGVCGSDVHQYHNTQSWPVRTPVVLGHEFCGRIAEAGRDVKRFREGDYVVSETHAEIDESSPLSRIGLYNLDPCRRGFGAGVDGAMTQYVKVPERCLHRVPENLPPEVAALTEPCCVAYNAVAVNSRMRAGDLVVVIGPGPIGLLCVAVARLEGAGRILLVGLTRDRPRLEAGKQLGATDALDMQVEDVKQRIAEIGDGLGAHLVIDASGASASLESALAWVRPAGWITKVGWGPQPLNFSLDSLVQKAVTLQGSFSHNWPVWERVVELLASGRLDVKPLLSRVAPLPEWQSCFDAMADGSAIKAVLVP